LLGHIARAQERIDNLTGVEQEIALEAKRRLESESEASAETRFTIHIDRGNES
jgi:hypothetical protein